MAAGPGITPRAPGSPRLAMRSARNYPHLLAERARPRSRRRQLLRRHHRPRPHRRAERSRAPAHRPRRHRGAGHDHHRRQRHRLRAGADGRDPPPRHPPVAGGRPRAPRPARPRHPRARHRRGARRRWSLSAAPCGRRRRRRGSSSSSTSPCCRQPAKGLAAADGVRRPRAAPGRPAGRAHRVSRCQDRVRGGAGRRGQPRAPRLGRRPVDGRRALPCRADRWPTTRTRPACEPWPR